MIIFIFSRGWTLLVRCGILSPILTSLAVSAQERAREIRIVVCAGGDTDSHLRDPVRHAKTDKPADLCKVLLTGQDLGELYWTRRYPLKRTENSLLLRLLLEKVAAHRKDAAEPLKVLLDADAEIPMEYYVAIRNGCRDRGIKTVECTGFSPLRNLKDTDAAIRTAAAEGLGGLGELEHAPALVELLKDDDVEVRGAAIRALGWLGYRQASKDIASLLSDENAALRASAISFFELIQDRAQAPEVVRHLGDPDETVRLAARNYILNTRAVEHVNRVIPPETEDSAHVWQSSVWTLATLGKREHVDSLKNFLTLPHLELVGWEPLESEILLALGTIGARVLDPEGKQKLAAAMAPYAGSPHSQTALAASIGRVALGSTDSLRIVLKSAQAAEGPSFRIAAHFALVLLQVHDARTFTQLTQRNKLKRPIENAMDARRLFEEQGLLLQDDGVLIHWGRRPEGIEVSLLEVCEEMCFGTQRVPFVEKNTVRLMSPKEALSAWEAKLK